MTPWVFLGIPTPGAEQVQCACVNSAYCQDRSPSIERKGQDDSLPTVCPVTFAAILEKASLYTFLCATSEVVGEAFSFNELMRRDFWGLPMHGLGSRLGSQGAKACTLVHKLP